MDLEDTIISYRKKVLLRVSENIKKYASLLTLIKLNTFSSEDNSISENIELCVKNYCRGYIIGKPKNLLHTIINLENSKFLNININPPNIFNDIDIYSCIENKKGLYEIAKNDIIDDTTFFCLTHYIFISYIFNSINTIQPLLFKFYNKEPRLAYPTNLLSQICKCPIKICEFFFFVIVLVLKDSSSINIKNKKICSLYYDKNNIFSTISDQEIEVLCNSLLIKNINTIYILINSIIDFQTDFCNHRLTSDNLIKISESGWFQLIYIAIENIYHEFELYDEIMDFFQDSNKNTIALYQNEIDFDNGEDTIEQLLNDNINDNINDQKIIDWKFNYYL